MKIFNSIIILLLILVTSCSRIQNITMTVTKNCTGVYLSQNDKNYYVCNREILEDIEVGKELVVTYKNVEECKSPYEGIVCFMLFPSEGNINVLKIK